MTERRHILKEYDNYIDGNTVRKHAEVTKRQERIDRKIVTSRKTLRNREKATRMNLGAVIVLGVCCAAMGVFAIKYLSLRDQITNKTNEIAEVKVQTEALKAQNDAVDYSINSGKDTNYIIQVATNELGMVQANKNQIRLYESSESQYMKQYKNIPEE